MHYVYTPTQRERPHPTPRDIFQDSKFVFQVQGQMTRPTICNRQLAAREKVIVTGLNVQLPVDAECGVLQRFRDGHIRILEIGILANKSD